MKRSLLCLPVLALLLPDQALAHAKLTSSSPPEGGQLAKEAKDITLTFDALISQASCSAVDAAGAAVANLGVATPEREKVRVPLAGVLSPGSYILTCKVKADRHETGHTVKFVVP